MIFLTNEGESDIKTDAYIDGAASLVAMDLWRGEYWREPSTVHDEKTHFHLDLKYRESRLLILDGEGKFDAPAPREKHFVSVDFTLTEDDLTKYKKTYSGILNVDQVDSDSLWLAVSAEEMVECFVNGDFAGFSLWNTHQFNLSPYLKCGENDILLKVTGNAANRFTNHKIQYGLQSMRSLQ